MPQWQRHKRVDINPPKCEKRLACLASSTSFRLQIAAKKSSATATSVFFAVSNFAGGRPEPFFVDGLKLQDASGCDMQVFLTILLVLAVTATVVMLVRGIISFLKTTEDDLNSDGPSEGSLKQNKMMMGRIGFQAIAVVIVIVMLALARK
jgi:Hypoxia induced protein conserved region